MIDVDMSENPPSVVVYNKVKTMETTIPCLGSVALDGDCCGCLNATYDELKKTWIFRCNECSKEWGRGSIKAGIDKKKKDKAQSSTSVTPNK